VDAESMKVLQCGGLVVNPVFENYDLSDICSTSLRIQLGLHP
jgi:hypothetical protein